MKTTVVTSKTVDVFYKGKKRKAKLYTATESQGIFKRSKRQWVEL